MTLSIIVYIIICVFAVLIFLLHESEKGGMGIIGGSSNSVLGTSRLPFIGKLATVFAVLFFISALFLSIMSSGNKSILQSITVDPTETVETIEVAPTTENTDSTTE